MRKNPAPNLVRSGWLVKPNPKSPRHIDSRGFTNEDDGNDIQTTMVMTVPSPSNHWHLGYPKATLATLLADQGRQEKNWKGSENEKEHIN